MDDPNFSFISTKDALKDEKRIRYYSGYLSSLLASIKYVVVVITCCYIRVHDYFDENKLTNEVLIWLTAEMVAM